MTDQLNNLWNYSVSELLVSVNPSGNPMTCSAVSGTGYRWPSTRLHQSCQLFRSGLFTPRLGDCLPPLNAVALGVGHNPHSVAKLSGTSVGSRYAMPFRIIPERGQVSENSPNSPSKESCDVFHDDEAGSKLVNQSAVVGPQPASCAVKTLATTCEANVLAGKSSNDSIRVNPVCSELICGKLSNIIIDGNTGKAFAQAGLGLAIELAERDRLEPARPLQPEVEASDAGEQGQDAVGLVMRHCDRRARRGGTFTPVAGLARGIGAKGNGSGRGHLLAHVLDVVGQIEREDGDAAAGPTAAIQSRATELGEGRRDDTRSDAAKDIERDHAEQADVVQPSLPLPRLIGERAGGLVGEVGEMLVLAVTRGAGHAAACPVIGKLVTAASPCMARASSSYAHAASTADVKP